MDQAAIDRDTVLALLPEFIRGELPSELEGRVRATLAGSPELQVLAEELGGVHLIGAEIFRRRAPSSVTAPPRAHRAGWALAVAAALALSLGGWLGLGARDGAPVADYARVGAQSVDRGEGWIDATSPQALSAAFAAQGISPPLSMVVDLSRLGLEVVGGRVIGDGTVAIYRAPDGREYSCQMYADGAVDGAPIERLRAPRAGLPDIDLHVSGALAMALWRERGMVCIFAGSVEPRAMASLAMRRLWGDAAPS